ncbi:unnamed protein product [Haemonchus placei]|uniref:Dynein light chain n=1 Tax=Haemonchus placei TaxID=6290 RepID=A0A0N4VTZ3_HAEPC|nr:unnamed protein product [Haemonchus placei]
MKNYGKLKSKNKIKRIETKGHSYVTPYNSLIGLEWIRANEQMKYPLEMMTAEIKVTPMVKIEEELKKTYPGVVVEGLERCTKQQVFAALHKCVPSVL